jgi:hypothetical protein
MAAEEEAAGNLTSHEIDGGAKSLLVMLCAATRWRAGGARLAKGKIAPQHRDAGMAEGVGQGSDKRCGATAACAMRQDKAVFSGDPRKVQESSNEHIPD